MIKIGRISDIEKEPGTEYWLVVRKLDRCPNGAIHVPVLSPSQGLFHEYLDARNCGKWDKSYFDRRYVPRFVRQMAMDPQARALLNELYKRSRTDDIMLACFCVDEALCHRSILAGMLLGAGADVRCDPGYAKYYGMFRAELAGR